MYINDKINNAFSIAVNHAAKGEVYFIGIGGIGMSAIAKFFQAAGSKVSGYDRTPTVITRQMELSGIPVHYEDSEEFVPKDVSLVIYTPAIPVENKAITYCRENGFTLMKRSDVLQLITASSFNICVGGTHGKTTITSMVAHILRHSGFGCNAFLGGIAVNYGTNFWHSEKNVCVVEADEYDRSFLKLQPDIAVVTAMDADHLDIYGTLEEVEKAYIDFAKKINKDGLLIAKFGLKRELEKAAPQYLSYSLQNDAADIYATNITMNDGTYQFDVVIENEPLQNFQLTMGGMHNVENAVAAIAVAFQLKIETDKIREAIYQFKGIKRRFEYIIKNNRLVFIDDYAHHPEELKSLITSAKTLFKQRKCTIVFQPHLYSRTRDLADEFAAALDLADQVVLLPIYAAREQPDEATNSELILEKMQLSAKQVIEKNDLIKWVNDVYFKEANKEFGEIFITAGAGDIDMLVETLKNLLKQL